VPALRKALRDEKDEDHRQGIILGLIACGGLPDAEMVAALEAYAEKIIPPGGREEVLYRPWRADPLTEPVSIGRYLALKNDAPES